MTDGDRVAAAGVLGVDIADFKVASTSSTSERRAARP
jgi:hypothetical protein